MLRTVCKAALVAALVIPCIEADCGVPPSIPNATNNATGSPPYPEDTTLRYECEPGYNTAGTSRYYICSNTDWTDGNFRCEQIYCSFVEPPDNGRALNVSTNEVGSVIEFTCNEGYDMSPVGSSMTCRSDGQWLPPAPPTCTAKDCGEFLSIQYADTFQDNSETERNHYGSIVEVTCRDGRVINGPTHVKCEADGQWGNRPTCIHLQCPAYPNTNSSCVAKTQLSGNFYFILCKEDISTRTGPDAAECISGEWDSLEMACLCDCAIPEHDSNLISMTNLNNLGYLHHGTALEWTCDGGRVRSSFEDVICIDGKLKAVKDGNEVLFPNHSNESDINLIIMSEICTLPTTESSTTAKSLLTYVSSASSEMYTPADIPTVLTTSTLRKYQEELPTTIVATTSLPTSILSTTSGTGMSIEIPAASSEISVTKSQNISPTTVVLSSSGPISASSSSSNTEPDLPSDISSSSMTKLLPSSVETKLDSWTEDITTSEIKFVTSRQESIPLTVLSGTESFIQSSLSSYFSKMDSSSVDSSLLSEKSTPVVLKTVTGEDKRASRTDFLTDIPTASTLLVIQSKDISPTAVVLRTSESKPISVSSASSKMDRAMWSNMSTTGLSPTSTTMVIKLMTEEVKITSGTSYLNHWSSVDPSLLSKPVFTKSQIFNIKTGISEKSTTVILKTVTEEDKKRSTTDLLTDIPTAPTLLVTQSKNISPTAVALRTSESKPISTSSASSKMDRALWSNMSTTGLSPTSTTMVIKLMTEEVKITSGTSYLNHWSSVDPSLLSKPVFTKSQIFSLKTGISEKSTTVVLKTVTEEDKKRSTTDLLTDIPTAPTLFVTQNKDISPTAVVLRTSESKPISVSSASSKMDRDLWSNMSTTGLSPTSTTMVIKSMTEEVKITSGTSCLNHCFWLFIFFLCPLLKWFTLNG